LEDPSVEIQISVDDVTLAPELMRQLAGLFEPSTVSWVPAQNQVRVHSEWGSRRVVGLIEIVAAWIEEHDVASATMSMGDHSHTLVRSTPVPVMP
jgi:hypothetical protein